MKYNLTLSRAQAGALARLIQTHIESYEEADCGAVEPRQRPPTRKAVEPFTGADLDLVEPLVVSLESFSSPKVG